jgi:peptide/nickel transport system permease protein
LIMIYPSIWWGWSPPMELVSFTKDPLGHLEIFIIPALINGTMMAGMSMRLVRTMMLEVMRQDYIRTAWSKGLNEKTVVIKHAVKNAFIPVVTMLGGSVATIFGGTVIMEQIFNIPGVGLLSLQSLGQRDYPVIVGIVIFMAAIVMLSNLVVDISYSWLDPRVRYQ